MDEELRDFIEKTVGESVDKAVAKMRCDSEKSTGQERKPEERKKLLQMYMGRQKDIRVGKESKKRKSDLQLFKAPSPKSDCVNIKIGAMSKKVGTRGHKETKPCRIMCLKRSSSYAAVVSAAKVEFFGSGVSGQFYLANAEGLRLSDHILDKAWTLDEFLTRNGIFPSKVKLFCVNEHARTTESNSIAIQNNASVVAVSVTSGPDKGESDVVSGLIDSLRVPLSSFTLQKRIGRGGFGEVFVGVFRSTICAVKKIYSGGLEFHFVDEEVKTLAKLRHPNIVCFMGFGKSETHYFLITSYIKGCNLDELIFEKKDVSLSLNTIINYAEKIASALGYMHGQQPPLLHRDLKPANVLVDENGENVFLCDMGLAKMKSGLATLTRCGQEGTPSYISPETLIRRQCGPTSDSWAFGLILVEMSTRKRAWGSLLTTVEVTSLVLQSVAPENLREVTFPTIRRLCEACLNYDEKKRPTMTTVATELRQTTLAQ